MAEELLQEILDTPPSHRWPTPPLELNPENWRDQIKLHRMLNPNIPCLTPKAIVEEVFHTTTEFSHLIFSPEQLDPSNDPSTNHFQDSGYYHSGIFHPLNRLYKPQQIVRPYTPVIRKIHDLIKLGLQLDLNHQQPNTPPLFCYLPANVLKTYLSRGFTIDLTLCRTPFPICPYYTMKSLQNRYSKIWTLIRLHSMEDRVSIQSQLMLSIIQLPDGPFHQVLFYL